VRRISTEQSGRPSAADAAAVEGGDSEQQQHQQQQGTCHGSGCD